MVVKQSAGRDSLGDFAPKFAQLNGDSKLFWDRTNWQSLCKPCHDRKTMTENRYPVYHY